MIDPNLLAILREHNRAVGIHGPFNSYHEAYAVIKEEVDELWDEIKGRQDRVRMYEEATQIAAMCLRMMNELVDITSG